VCGKMSEDLVVTGGCFTDCKRLINNFVKSSDQTAFYFIDFAKEWRKLHFDLIYSGRDKNVELPEFARELFTIVKKMFLLKTATLPEKIGALFLMYSLYYKQENLNTKFRFTYHEFHEVLTFMDTLRNKGHEDAEFTFVHMFTDNAFHFTATSSEYIQINVKAHSIEDEVKKDIPVNHLVKLLESSDFNLLETLHTEYIQRKQLLPELPSSSTSQAAVNEKMIDKIKNHYIALTSSVDGKVVPFCPDNDEDDDNDIGERRRVIKGQAMRSGEEYRIPGSSMRGRRPGQRGGSRERGTRGTSKRGKKFINQ